MKEQSVVSKEQGLIKGEAPQIQLHQMISVLHPGVYKESSLRQWCYGSGCTNPMVHSAIERLTPIRTQLQLELNQEVQALVQKYEQRAVQLINSNH